MKSNRVFYLTCSLSFLLLSLNSFCLKAQKRCNTSELTKMQLSKHPELLQQKKKFDHLVNEKVKQLKQSAQKNEQSIITIPVVFHVIYNNSEQNVSNGKLESQIEVLNEDYRRENSDATTTWSQAADTEIEFCLSAVTRTQTDSLFFSYQHQNMYSNATGGVNIWQEYLNIYVCNYDVTNSFVLGTAPFPTMSPNNEDGVVLDYHTLGRIGNNLIPNFDLGRTATHEIGHWLNLEHMWGPGEGSCTTDDGVSDTPISGRSHNQCEDEETCGTPDMSENFMDYHFDRCMNLFTTGQKLRMRASINSARPYLLNHNKCDKCATSVNINDNYQNKTKVINYNGNITANNDIYNNSDVRYFAEHRVTLNTGFSVDQSSDFKASTVGNCGG